MPRLSYDRPYLKSLYLGRGRSSPSGQSWTIRARHRRTFCIKKGGIVKELLEIYMSSKIVLYCLWQRFVRVLPDELLWLYKIITQKRQDRLRNELAQFTEGGWTGGGGWIRTRAVGAGYGDHWHQKIWQFEIRAGLSHWYWCSKQQSLPVEGHRDMQRSHWSLDISADKLRHFWTELFGYDIEI